jgi:hypothetical protein
MPNHRQPPCLPRLLQAGWTNHGVFEHPPNWGWEKREPLGPNLAVFIFSWTEGETVGSINSAAEKRGMAVLKTYFPEMGLGYWDGSGTRLSDKFTPCDSC